MIDQSVRTAELVNVDKHSTVGIEMFGNQPVGLVKMLKSVNHVYEVEIDEKR